jgi:hypothetical protein
VRVVEVLEEAADDIEDAIIFYNQQSLGVGEYFAQSILADLERLRFLHGIHSKHFGFYRMLAGRFPFGIYYRDTDKATEVFAILDLRKDPLWLRDELTDRNA